MIARHGKEALLKNNKLLFTRTFLLERLHSVGAGGLPLALLMSPSGCFAGGIAPPRFTLIPISEVGTLVIPVSQKRKPRSQEPKSFT